MVIVDFNLADEIFVRVREKSSTFFKLKNVEVSKNKKESSRNKN